MDESWKTIPVAIVLSAIWICLGVLNARIESISELPVYIFAAVPYIVFLFLPLSILSFSNSVPLRMTSWVGVLIGISLIVAGFYMYFKISDVRTGTSLFTVIYGTPDLLLVSLGWPK